MNNPFVLIVGAGPTGLALALWLMRLGVRVRLIDKSAEPGTTSRALAVACDWSDLCAKHPANNCAIKRPPIAAS